MVVIRVGPRMAISTVIAAMTKLRQEDGDFEARMDKEGRSEKREG